MQDIRTDGVMRSRADIYRDWFGAHAAAAALAEQQQSLRGIRQEPLSRRVEDIPGLESFLRDPVELLTKCAQQQDPRLDSYVLTREADIRSIPDTHSLSSLDNTPASSPRRSSPRGSPPRSNNTSSPSKPAAPMGYPTPAEDPGLTNGLEHKRSRMGIIPRRKPSLPQLNLGGLKKQSSFSTPTSASKKNSFQGLFRLRDSDTDQESSSQSGPNSARTASDNVDYQNRSTDSQSLSLNSFHYKNLASSFHSKTTNPRKTSQKQYDDGQHHITHAYTNPNLSTMGNTPHNNMIGIKSRVSSSSLASKRYHSGSIYSGTTPTATTRRNSAHFQKNVGGSISKRPLVYPALLSRVASAFKATIELSEYKKDGIIYRDAFTGQQAVDNICSIIRTNDRSLALLLGRSLDLQKLFHDVVYEHRLRDSPLEIYEFTDNSRFIGTGQPPSSVISEMSISEMNSMRLSHSESSTSLSSQQTLMTPDKHITRHHNVSGVFTLLAECYSPTCTRDALCYSISCPRRLEQQARLNLKPHGGLKRNISLDLKDDEEEKPSWTSSVPKECWETLSKKEIKRQEAIYEVFMTEKKFVKSLEITRETFMKTLAETNIIPADIRKNFIKHVFAHINDIYSVNRRFLESLADRQKSSPVVHDLGDILLRFIPFFEPFVSYVASRPYAKYLIETQRSVNPYFARFDDDMMNSSLRHGLDSFLSQGVSRPGRYMLLVKEIIKSSDEEKDKRDLVNLKKAMDLLLDFMKRIDEASGAAQDRHDVKLLKQKILFKNEYVNLGLNNEKRKIRHEGILSRKEMSKNDGSMMGDVQFYLLDNMLLFLKSKSVNKWHQHKVFQRPIPLPLLFACPSEDMPSLRKYIGERPDASGTVIQPKLSVSNPKNAITFLYYGAKQRYQVTLYAVQVAALQALLDKIKQEQERIIAETTMFNVTKISDRFFDYTNTINSVSSCDGGRKLLIATNSGLYISNIKRHRSNETKKTFTNFSTPVQLIQRSNITQVAVLDEFKSILLLIDKKLYSCSISLLDLESNGTSYFKKHSKELITHVNFFAEGDCNGKRLIVTAHSSSHSIKFFELDHPLLTDSSGSNRKSFKRRVNEVVFDSEPVSISFLKANLCIGCKRGFQIVSVSQRAHESLLDPADTSLDFALRDTLKPMAIYRVGNTFLLCYTEFAFFVNNQGWRKKDSHIIHWEGEPQKFAIWYPYVLAFDSNFIEIRKIDNGELVRCVLGDKIRLLQTNSQEILYAYEDSMGFDTVASIDFWG